MRDYSNELKQLNSDIALFSQELTVLYSQIEELEHEASMSGFWDDLEFAQKETRKLTQLKSQANQITQLRDLLDEFELLTEWGVMGEASEEEISQAFMKLNDGVALYKQSKYLSGKYDAENAIVTLHAGSGGTESEDYTDMILRMIGRWAESKHYQYKLTSRESGSIDGTKSATLLIIGENAYGYTKTLHGVWRLIRNSPYDKNNCRHTSFAAIDVVPQFNNLDEIMIKPEDVEWDTMRTSTKAGGQATNKNETAIRLYHKPTGISIRYDVERSQYQNKACALEMLKNQLMLLELRKRQVELNDIRGEVLENGWGSQIVTITLTPYQLVKDERTKWTTSNTAAFLNGEIDDFIRQNLEDKNGNA